MSKSNSLPALRASSGSNGRYVSFSDGKRQIRAALKKAGIEALGHFRPRKTNRGQFSLAVTGGSIVVDRKVGAEMVFVPAVIKQWTDLTDAEKAEILAIG
tara:strand:- start:720 stop:1019 length:300 start_codon:yes stop_codon:yes gene_type:complete